MLKHVSYRASSTSLSRPFANCRANTLSPQDKSNISSSSINTSSINSPVSAPNSPRMCQFPRHTRNHSITPTANKYSCQDETDSSSTSDTPDKQSVTIYRHNCNSNLLKSSSLPRTSEDVATLNQSHECSDGEVSLKPDDPLSRHRNKLRSVDCLTLRGELMPEMSPHSDTADNISLHSAISITSLNRNDLRASTTSLCASKIPVRIHLRQLRPDIEYKTLRLDAETSCRQLIEHLLQKLRLKHRDPNLFGVVLEAAVRGPGGAPAVKKRFLLEDSARPVELQQCRPRGEANFSITMRRGGVLRVRDSVLTPGSQYKSFLVSYTSTTLEIIQLLLKCNNRTDDYRMFNLHEVCDKPFNDRLLDHKDKPLFVQNSWPKNVKHKYSLVLRRSLTQGLIERENNWRRLSIGESGMRGHVELDEHNSTCSSIITTSSDSSRSRSSISSSTASVHSLASLSSESSSRCSFSSNSSSGVSSGSSSSYSPTETPEKDRKIHHKRQLPPIPLTPSSLVKKYPISVEENIQSYFSIHSDDELVSTKANVTKNEVKSVTILTAKRPPQPLPRRVLNFPPVHLPSSKKDEVFDSEIEDSNETNKNFTKSWSSTSCFSSALWIKARGPAAQSWQNRSRSARIRSATISTPIEHMANLSIYSRSRSNDQSRVSTSTLTSQPSTPTHTSPNSSKTVFTYTPLPCMSRAQSTSSINNSVSSYTSPIYHPVIAPLSSKLRPLSLAPNSSIAFPARPTSLLSSQSQSTTTLRASSSSLNLTATASPDGQSSFVLSLTNSNSPTNHSTNLYQSSKQSPEVISCTYHSFSNIKTPTKSLFVGHTAKQILVNDPKTIVEKKETNDIPIKSVETEPEPHVCAANCSMPSDSTSTTCNTQNDSKSDSESGKIHDNGKHCQSCCRYDNCFYI